MFPWHFVHTLFFFFFWDTLLLCSPGCPGSHSVGWASFKLSILLLQPTECWDYWVLGLQLHATMPIQLFYFLTFLGVKTRDLYMVALYHWASFPTPHTFIIIQTSCKCACTDYSKKKKKSREEIRAALSFFTMPKPFQKSFSREIVRSLPEV